MAVPNLLLPQFQIPKYSSTPYPLVLGFQATVDTYQCIITNPTYYEFFNIHTHLSYNLI
jgi:hypothetical protein